MALLYKKKKGPVRLYLTDPIKTVFTEVKNPPGQA